MEELLKFLNSRTTSEQEEFAEACDTTVSYLRKAMSIGQKLRVELCVAIERESGGKVTRKQLRPDDWHLLWPELVKKAA